MTLQSIHLALLLLLYLSPTLSLAYNIATVWFPCLQLLHFLTLFHNFSQGELSLTSVLSFSFSLLLMVPRCLEQNTVTYKASMIWLVFSPSFSPKPSHLVFHILETTSIFLNIPDHIMLPSLCSIVCLQNSSLSIPFHPPPSLWEINPFTTAQEIQSRSDHPFPVMPTVPCTYACQSLSNSELQTCRFCLPISSLRMETGSCSSLHPRTWYSAWTTTLSQCLLNEPLNR